MFNATRLEKCHKVKVTSLSREDLEPLGGNDFSKGSQLLLEYNKKSYPVSVLKVESLTEGCCCCCCF